jgi:hypothetical protein
MLCISRAATSMSSCPSQVSSAVASVRPIPRAPRWGVAGMQERKDCPGSPRTPSRVLIWEGSTSATSAQQPADYSLHRVGPAAGSLGEAPRKRSSLLHPAQVTPKAPEAKEGQRKRPTEWRQDSNAASCCSLLIVCSSDFSVRHSQARS